MRGDILVIGGRLIRAAGARHEGRQRVYWDAAPVDPHRRGPARDPRAAPPDRRSGRGAYQLPDREGAHHAAARDRAAPTTGSRGCRSSSAPPSTSAPARRSAFKLDLRGILRTAGSETRLADFGYHARGEFRLGRFGIAGRVYSELTPIEDHPLSLERGGLVVLPAAARLSRLLRPAGIRRAGLGADRPAAQGRGLPAPRRRALGAGDRSLVPVPQQRPWRRNPLIDDGHYITTGAPARLRHPERALSAEHRLADPGPLRALEQRRRGAGVLPPLVRPELPLGRRYAFDRVFLDVRRYSRITPSLRVNARLRADGWVAGDRLPVQRRVSLGGPDLLPGYDFRAFTCAPSGFTDPSQPALCDRVVTAQVEVRTRLGSQPGLPDPRPREPDAAASSASRKRIWSSSPMRARAGSPAAARARCR